MKVGQEYCCIEFNLNFQTFQFATEIVSLGTDPPLGYLQWVNVASSSFFHRYYIGRCSSELAELVLPPHYCGRSTRYSNMLHGFSVTIPRYYKDVYANSFCSHSFSSSPWCPLPAECFPLTYDLNGFKSSVKWHLFSLNSS